MEKSILPFVICCLISVTGCSSTSSTDMNESASEKTSSSAVEKDVVKLSLVSQDEYVRDGEKCILYRVTADRSTDVSEDEWIDAFKEFIADRNDNYYLHDVMVYSSSDIADGSDAWDIAEIEETGKGKQPAVTVR